MSSKIILFRADSSSQIGTGHIMRDLVLAQKYVKKGYKIVFVTQELDGNINHKIIESGYKVKILKNNKFKTLQKVINKYKPKMLVIDNYDIDYKFEKKLKKSYPNIKLMILDDTYEKHYCDIVLNHNISAKKIRYKNKVPKWCKLKCGAKYTLIRDEFKKVKKLKKIKNDKFTIFLAMGGADHKNLMLDILKVLESFDVNVNVVTTNANKNLNLLKDYSLNKEWIKLYINSNNIAKLMKKSDMAIVAPSVILNEVFFLNINFIAIQSADNQKYMSEFLEKKGYNILKKFDKKNLKNLLNLEILKELK